MTTTGITSTNLPIRPVMPNIGMKAAIEVQIEASTGHITSRAPMCAASCDSRPSSMWR